MSDYDLMQELQEKIRLIDIAVHQLGKRGKAFAEAEKRYRIDLAKKMLSERANGQPATILADICRGDAEIAHLRFLRDVAEVNYKAAMEAINNYKLQMRLLEGQIQREWSNVRE